MVSEVKKLWPAGLVLGLAILIVSLTSVRFRTPRLANLALDHSDMPDVYLVFDRTDRQRCYVVDRRDSTIRRGDSKQSGRKWDCLQLRPEAGGGGSDTWLLQSKRVGHGTAFLVPALDVPDWTYPFLYGFVRQRHEALGLPPVAWVQLYTDRIYQGLYLWVALPFDKRKKDGGSGTLRELLTVQGHELTVVNTRFDAARGLYAKAVAGGVFPALSPPPPALAWLARRAPTPGTTFLMSNVAPHEVSLLPLPVALPELYKLKEGRPAPTFKDRRYRQWTQGAWRTEPAAPFPFSADDGERLQVEFEAYAARIRTALHLQVAAQMMPEHLADAFLKRQAAAADVQLSLGKLW